MLWEPLLDYWALVLTLGWDSHGLVQVYFFFPRDAHTSTFTLSASQCFPVLSSRARPGRTFSRSFIGLTALSVCKRPRELESMLYVPRQHRQSLGSMLREAQGVSVLTSPAWSFLEFLCVEFLIEDFVTGTLMGWLHRAVWALTKLSLRKYHLDICA